MKKIAIIAAVLGLSLGLVGCEMTDAQKEAKAFKEFCMKGNNMAEVPECSVFVGQ